jgi:glycosyltransferase involved in cell wall biosynthesis
MMGRLKCNKCSMSLIKVHLLTLGDPNKRTGGYLFHRRLADAAPRHRAVMAFRCFPEWPFPLPTMWGRNVMRLTSDADVIVVDSIVAAFSAPWLRRTSRPIVGMLHQGPGGIDHGQLRSRLQARLDRHAYKFMQVLLVASESLALDLHSAHSHVVVVPPGRDVAPISDLEATDLRRGRAASFLCVGNWVARKGITDLLDAFARLPEQAGTLHLVGDDAVDSHYTAKVLARIRRVSDRVVVHGPVSPQQIAGLYRSADVFVMPSYREPYGTVYGEAMAAGLPVVGWRAGNLPFLADHGHEGLLVEPGDVRGLAEALFRLSTDRSLRRDMGRAAAARAATFPSWEETAERFFDQLHEIVGRAHR